MATPKNAQIVILVRLLLEGSALGQVIELGSPFFIVPSCKPRRYFSPSLSCRMSTSMRRRHFIPSLGCNMFTNTTPVNWKVHVLLSNCAVSFDPTIRGYSFNLLSASGADDLNSLQLHHSFANRSRHNRDPLQLCHSPASHLAYDQVSHLPNLNSGASSSSPSTQNLVTSLWSYLLYFFSLLSGLHSLLGGL